MAIRLRAPLPFTIPAPHYTYFEQFDWPKKKFYTSLNSTSKNLGTIFLPSAPKVCNNVDKNKIGIIRNELSFFMDFIDV